MFETFRVPSLFVATQAVLTVYAHGEVTGCALDIGEGSSQVVPVYEGFLIPHAMARIDLAGREVSEYLQQLLTDRDRCFATPSLTLPLRQIKETMCFVANRKKSDEGAEEEFELSDGSCVTVGSERWRCAEVLFDTSSVPGKELPNLPDLLIRSVKQCDLSIRGPLLSKVMLSGGTSKLPGFRERLLKELTAKAYPTPVALATSPFPDAGEAVWLGGSVLADIESFADMVVRREEYEEEGASVVHSRCMVGGS